MSRFEVEQAISGVTCVMDSEFVSVDVCRHEIISVTTAPCKPLLSIVARCTSEVITLYYVLSFAAERDTHQRCDQKYSHSV
jgi:hypothetical protein